MKIVKADTACGTGAYCTGTNRYLQVTGCSLSGNQAYCYNTNTQSVTMTCPTGGGSGSCTGSAPGKNGCGGSWRSGSGSESNCSCTDGSGACSGNGSQCGPYPEDTCECLDSGSNYCVGPGGGSLGCCLSAPYCGDGSCNNGETCSSCSQDCGSCGGPTSTPIPPTSAPSGNCGNGVVNSGENCSNCPADVGSCQPAPTSPPSNPTSAPLCPNGTVNAGEDCNNCPQDVGVCECIPDPDVCAGELCGQINGCGGFCSDRDNDAPPAPTINTPADDTITTMYDSTDGLGDPVKAVDLIFTTQTDTNYNAYYTYLDVYPVGTSCADPLAQCAVLVSSGAGKGQQLTYTYTIPLAAYGDQSEFQWRVWHQNNSCSDLAGAYSAWSSFIMGDTITGTVLQDDGLAGLSGGVCVSPLSPQAYTPTGAEVITVTYNGTDYTTTLNPDGTWSIQVPVSNSGENEVAFASNSGGADACGCPSGCVYTGIDSPATDIVIYFQSNDVRDKWWQTIGGSVYAGETTGTSVESLIPVDTCFGAGCEAYLSLRDDEGDVESSGVAFTGGGGIDTSNTSGFQSDNLDEDARNIQSTDAGTDTLIENYAYFYRLYSMGINPASELTADPVKPTVPPANERAYFHTGDMNINTDWTLSGSESIVVFVNGNLHLNAEVVAPAGTFLAFIVSGDITVDPTVCQSDPSSTVSSIQGVYIADGSFTVESNGTGDCKFVAEGIFTAWNGIYLQRDYRDGGAGDFLNADHATEVFRYRPDFVVNIPTRMTRPLYQWQEVAP